MEATVAKWELYEMFQALMQAPAYHLVLEGLLLLWVMWLMFHKSYKIEKNDILTETEKDALIAEWKPDPLVPDTPTDHYALHPRTVVGKPGKQVCIDGRTCLNMATHNYLGFVQKPEFEEIAVKALRKYGVGSCGPRGFYGTVDVHIDLESKLASFMQVEEAILYSYGFAAISSAIPAYSKAGDVIFCDDGVNFAIQKGLIASRSKIKFFKHNDVDDLERLLIEQEDWDKKNPKQAKVTRRFLVVEGLYMNSGDICPLPKLMELKKKHKVRIFIDEGCSLFVLGKTGHGITEFFGIPVEDVDLIAGTLEYSLGSFGGFCCGSSYVVDHQRLSGLGYCFSASLPPLQAAVAMAALRTVEQQPDVLHKLKQNCIFAHNKLKEVPQLIVGGDPLSPIKHLYIRSEQDRPVAILKLEEIVNKAQEKDVALTVARYLDNEEHTLPPPSIRLIINSMLGEDDITHVVEVLKECCTAIL